MNEIYKKITLICLSLFIVISYFAGLYLNENSIGSGGYNGDLVWIWKNFEIFKNTGFVEAIKSDEFFGNRTALLYILNIYFNPFINDLESYRISITFFSLLVSIFFFQCLREKYKDLNYETALLLSLIILLSPFFRSSAYWGMEIQYGLISSILSILFLFKNKNIENASYFNLFLTIFFSSITVYFDLKLVIIPLYIYLRILFSNLDFNKKLFSTFCYSLLATPYLFLINLWEGVVPKATQKANPLQYTHLKSSKLHMINFLYATNILGFYLMPFVIFKKNIFCHFKKFFNGINFILTSIFLSYLVYFIFFDLYDYADTITRENGGYKNFWGLGYSDKISEVLFDNRIYSLYFNLIVYLISFVIVILFINSSLINFLLILFFLIISIALFPLMQEYFDPYIYIIAMLLAKNDYDFSFKKCCLVFLYFQIFLSFSIIYYT